MPRSGELLDRLLEALSDERAPAVALRHRLHAAPELAQAEHATSAAVGEALDRPTERAAGTGVVALVGAGPAAIGVRAELDGMPIKERTGAPYASTNGAMHACGHDVHTAALVRKPIRRARSCSRASPLSMGCQRCLRHTFIPSSIGAPSRSIQVR
jgi:amidohydrolase